MRRTAWIIPAVAMAMGFPACGDDSDDSSDATTAAEGTAAAEDEGGGEAFDRSILSSFKPLPEVAEPTAYTLSAELVDLGRMLFYEPRMSISQEIACNSCHLLDNFGVDGLQFSLGHEGIPVGRNSPTVYNAALHIAQFWDGRAEDVEAQAKGPILAAGEMGMPNPEYVEQVLQSIPGYEPLFEAAFPDASGTLINYDNVAIAIGAFERGLMTPGRWDEFLNGDDAALTAEEKAGLQMFVSTGCTACHNGAAMGGGMFAKLGTVKEYADVEDVGRQGVTGLDADLHSFKVPSLRNIAETAPYLHDGSFTDLTELTKFMAEYQLGKTLSDADAASIVTFLKALTGTVPADYIALPELPESGPETPGPYEYEETTG